MKFGPKREWEIGKGVFNFHTKVAAIEEQQSHNCRNLNFEVVFRQGSQTKCRKIQKNL